MSCCSSSWGSRTMWEAGAAGGASEQTPISCGRRANRRWQPRRRAVDDADEDPRRRSDDGADRCAGVCGVRGSAGRPCRAEDADALPKIVRLSPIPVIADIHFNASLALKAVEGRCCCCTDQSRQHRRPGQGRAGREGGEAGGDPDADRRQLRLAAEASCCGPRAGRPGRGAGRGGPRGGEAARGARLPRLQDLRQVEPRPDDDPCLSDACPRRCRTPSTSASRRRARPFSGAIKSAGRHGYAARRRHR